MVNADGGGDVSGMVVHEQMMNRRAGGRAHGGEAYMGAGMGVQARDEGGTDDEGDAWK